MSSYGKPLTGKQKFYGFLGLHLTAAIWTPFFWHTHSVMERYQMGSFNADLLSGFDTFVYVLVSLFGLSGQLGIGLISSDLAKLERLEEDIQRDMDSRRP